ncbi:hypothetical protein [uncultured Tenacibaculum sp.]|uniref:hypothetical protein n=1 Tax=uncultured Tenacibaculum sp. TaxID=174713 RepID=UPI00261CD45C|nr:hypothetical protein [uncultured Tenacibaculum sp.]
MKKSILNLGKSLSKTEQKNINGGLIGGGRVPCPPSSSYTVEGHYTKTDGTRGTTCSYPSTLSGGIFPGSRCYGAVVGNYCDINGFQ